MSKRVKEKQHLWNQIFLQDWDYEANAPLTPNDYAPCSNKYVYWKCHKCGYKWRAKISNRVHGRQCPACSNKTVYRGVNDLQTTHPNLAKEWHPTKNGELNPSDVTYGQGKKVWWICPYGHEYQATILHRSSGTNCPICNSGRQTSFAEQAVYFYVKQIWPDAINRFKADFLGRMELDIYIPSIRYAIEYDGIAWHGDKKKEQDRKKYSICRANGIKLCRLSEDPKWIPFDDTCDLSFMNEDLYKDKNLEVAIQWLMSKLDFKRLGMTYHDVNIDRDRVQILELYKKREKDSSLSVLYPNIAKEWHPTKNGLLKPDSFKARSDIKVWWLCPDCGLSYQASPGHRVYGTGCSACGIKKSARAKAKKVSMIDSKTGKVIKEFESISDASREMNVNVSNIVSVCKGARTKAGGFIWKYID